MVINKDFRAFMQCLKDHNVQYPIISGYAVAPHGQPCYNKDLDIWISISVTNADKVIDAIRDFGFSSPQLQSEDFIHPVTIRQSCYLPNQKKLIPSASEIHFGQKWTSKVVVNIEGLENNFNNLIKKNHTHFTKY